MDLVVVLVPQFAVAAVLVDVQVVAQIVAFRPGVVGSLVQDVLLESWAEAMVAMEDVQSAVHLCWMLLARRSLLGEHQLPFWHAVVCSPDCPVEFGICLFLLRPNRVDLFLGHSHAHCPGEY